ncbi:MAG TPA: low affinity iron permease family protein [Candidatus Limnocylindrales bacterium]|nr:low affinity iron permease family protein [Candidatus Limnocylindrales bacterium]
MRDIFDNFANKASKFMGSPWGFGSGVLIIIGWVICGPLLGFSDTWLQTFDTTTAIITFFILFLIQNSQNRDAKSMELKLDELIRANKNARNKIIDLEELSEDELENFQIEFRKLAKKNPKIK